MVSTSLVQEDNVGSVDASGTAMMAARGETEIQRAWAMTPVRDRVRVLQRSRHIFAECVQDLCGAISPELARNPADTRVAEILPLLDACRFLERKAARILAPKRLGRSGRPLWLSGVASEIQRSTRAEQSCASLQKV